MKKTLIKFGLLVVGLVALFITYKLFFNSGGAKGDGTITLIVIDENGDEVIHDELEFRHKMTLLEVIQKHYRVTCRGPFNRVEDACSPKDNIVILGIEDVQTDFNRTFLAIYVNNKFSKVGINDIEFQDGDVIKIQVEDV